MWRRFFHRQTTDADLEEELEAHLAIETKRLMESGQLRAQAEREARRQLGSQALVMELTREAWGWSGLARAWQDIRYAARVLRREPAFTGAAVGFRHLPIGRDPALPLQPMQRRIERAVLDLQRVLGPDADRLSNAVAMLGAPLEHLKDEQVEGALHEFDAVAHIGRTPL